MLGRSRITYDACELQEVEQALFLSQKCLDERLVVEVVHWFEMVVAG